MQAKSGKQQSNKQQFEPPAVSTNPRIGKAQARRDFLPLVTALQQTRQAVEITDHGTSVAVLLDYESYQKLIKHTQPLADLRSLKGSVTILADLEQARREINQEMDQSIERSSELL